MLKKVVIAFGILALLFIGLLIFLGIDGRAYERWKSAHVLIDSYHGWTRDGAPWPPPHPTNYVWASWGTSYVYTASQNIDGQIYHGLFAFRAYNWPHHYAISTNGVVIDLGDKNGVRLLRFTKGRAAAW